MPKTNSRVQKQQFADEYVNLMTLRLAEGEKLPPVRELVKNSAFGQVMILKSIGRLVEKGLLVARARQGYYRSSLNSRSADRRRIDIIACSEAGYMKIDGFTIKLVQYLFDIGTQRHYSMYVHRVGYYESILAYRDLVTENKITDAFLVSPDNEEIVKFVRALDVFAVPVATAYHVGLGPAVVDAPDMMERQIDYLRSKGHSRIGFIHEYREQFGSIVLLNRLMVYYRKMAESGVRIYPEYVAPANNGGAELIASLEKMFDTPVPPSALICNDYWLPAVYSFFAARKKVVGKDVCVVTDGESCRLLPRPVMVFNSPKEMAEKAWQIMDDLLKGHDNRAIFRPELTILE